MKRILALLLALTMALSLFTVAASAAGGASTTETPLTIKSVTTVSDTHLEIEFSKPVVSFNGAVLLGVLNDEGTNWTEPMTGLAATTAMNVELKDGKLVCSLAADKVVGAVNYGKNLTDIIEAVKAEYGAQRTGIMIMELANAKDGVTVYDSGYLEEVVDETGGFLKKTATRTGNKRDVCAAAIEPVANVPNTIKAVTTISDTHLKIEFTKPVVSFNGAVLLGVLNDEETNWTTDDLGDLDTTVELKYELKADGTLVCHLEKDKAGMPTADARNLNKIAMAIADEGYQAGIMIMEMANADAGVTVYESGYLEEVVDKSGAFLARTATRTGNKRDVCAAAIVSVTAEEPTAITITSIKATTNVQYKITTSEPVTVPAGGKGAWALYHVANGTIVNNNDNRFDGTISPLDTPTTEFVWTITEKASITDVFDLAEEADYQVYFGINGPLVDGKITAERAFGENNAGFVPTHKITGSAQEAYAIHIESFVLDIGEPLTVVSATAINDTDIVIKFSAPVEIGYSPYICLRIVGQNNTPVFGESGKRMQYNGTWKFADDTQDTIIWTSDNWNVKGLLSLTGPWAKFNKDGNVTRLCIEELDDKKGHTIDTVGNGFIDNVVDAQGVMLTANLIAKGRDEYDGLYIDIVEDYEDPEFFLKSVEQTGDKKLTLTFNKPVYFDEKPYMAIRFVNEANVLQYEDGQPLQYQGSWEYGSEDKTVLIWTATYGGSVNAIVNRTGKFANYPDYKIMFCIEEIPADKKAGDTEDGTIHNMYTDGGIKLYANVIGAGTNRDGVYMPITGNYVPKESTSTEQKGFELPPAKEENKVIPTAGGPSSALIQMAAHTDITSMLPWVALGLGSAVFIGVVAVLVSILPKKKDE